MIEITKLKNNPNNPRTIKKEQLEKLKRSIQSFPEMMEKRPMVCVTDMDGKIFPLGGNMRLKAIKELGYKEVPETWVMYADDWSEEQRKEFAIKDNANFGEWNFDELVDNWDIGDLEEWGVDVPVKLEEEVELGTEITAKEAIELYVAENLNPEKIYIVVTFETKKEYETFITDNNVPLLVANEDMKVNSVDINYQKVFKYEDLHTFFK